MSESRGSRLPRAYGTPCASCAQSACCPENSAERGMKAACSAAGGLGQGRTGSDALPVGSRGRGRPSSPLPPPGSTDAEKHGHQLAPDCPTWWHHHPRSRCADRSAAGSPPRSSQFAPTPRGPRFSVAGSAQGPSGWRTAERFRKIWSLPRRPVSWVWICTWVGWRPTPRCAPLQGAPPTLIGPVYGMVAALAVSEKTSARNTRVSAKFRRLSDATARRELNIQRACGFYEYLARYRGPASVSHEDYGVSFSTISAPSDFGSGGADPTENSAASLPRALCQKNFA